MSISSAQWGSSYNATASEFVFLEDIVKEAAKNKQDTKGLLSANQELARFSDSVTNLKSQLIKLEGTMKKSEYEENKNLLAILLDKEAKLKLLLSNSQSQPILGYAQPEFGQPKQVSTSEIRLQQTKAIEYQDKGIDNLLSAIKSQKNIALGIGTEIESQNRLLDDIGEKVAGTGTKINTHTGLTTNIARGSGNCIYYCIIALLVVGIILVIAIPK